MNISTSPAILTSTLLELIITYAILTSRLRKDEMVGDVGASFVLFLFESLQSVVKRSFTESKSHNDNEAKANKLRSWGKIRGDMETCGSRWLRRQRIKNEIK